jgi:hypothetical protein
VARNLFSSVSLFVLPLLSTGCVSDELGSWEGPVSASSKGIVSGTPEAIGLLDFLNDPSTTFEVLDLDVGLDRRAAGNLIGHRNGGDNVYGTTDDDLFGSIREVDAVRWVGPRSIEKIVGFADSFGFVPTGTDYLGTWDGVDFTVDESDWTLDFVNSASEVQLDDDLGLNRRAVNSILDAGEIRSVAQLASLYYVGKSALRTLKGAALREEVSIDRY